MAVQYLLRLSLMHVHSKLSPCQLQCRLFKEDSSTLSRTISVCCDRKLQNNRLRHLQAQSPRVNRGDGTFALVLAPTRELAIQIQDVLCNILRRYFYLVRPLCPAMYTSFVSHPLSCTLIAAEKPSVRLSGKSLLNACGNQYALVQFLELCSDT